MKEWFCDLESYGEEYYKKHGHTFPYWLGAKSLKDEIIETVGTSGGEVITPWLDQIIQYAFDNEIEETILWFHNLGNFDGFFFIEYLLKRYEDNKQWTFGRVLEENKRILTLTLSYKKQKQKDKKRSKKTYTIKFRDTARLWPLPLDELGRAVGFPKIEGYDYNTIEEFKTLEDFKKHQGGKSYEYAHRDLEILKTFYIETRSLMDINKSPMTIASSSLEDMVSTNDDLKHYKWWIKDKDLWDEVNKAYIGGFTWVNPIYQLQKVYNIYKYDINSLYPSVMESNAFPYGNPSYKDRARYTYKLFNVKAKRVTAKSIPFYPFKNKLVKEFDIKENVSQYEKEVENIDINVNNYMLDFLKQWYDFEDIEITFIACWREKLGFFGEFMEHWKELKISFDGVNEGLRTITKLKQNSGYGKMGQNPERMTTRILKKEEVVENPTYFKRNTQEFYEGYLVEPIGDGEYYYCREDEPLKYVTVREQEVLLASPIVIADKITTLAKIQLLKDVIEDGEDYVAYMDTDSIHSVIPLDDKLWIDPSKYGAWKYEGLAEVSVYRRSKHYLQFNIDEGKGKIKDYLLKGGGFNVRRFNKTKEIDIDTYLQPEFIVSHGKLSKERVKGGIILKEQDYKFGMPKWWMERNKEWIQEQESH